MTSFDFLREHFDKWQDRAANDPLFLAAITSSRYAFEKWHFATDSTAAYAAAVLLHPTLREAYFRKYWPFEWQKLGLKSAHNLWKHRYEGRISPEQSPQKELDDFDTWRATLLNTVGTKVNNEFEHFIKSAPIGLTATSPIDWWLQPQQQQLYPNLSRMAIDVLSINPMSAESERVFSGCRRTLSWDRARLSATSLLHIECLKHWRKNLNFCAVDITIDEEDKEEDDMPLELELFQPEIETNL
jgi:hypothetical protein